MDLPDLLIGVSFAACVGLAAVCWFIGLGLAGVTVLLMLGDLARPKG